MLDAAPDQMRGRLLGLLAFDRATMLVGAAAGGVLAEILGTQRAQIVYATLLVLSSLAILLFAKQFRGTVIGMQQVGRSQTGHPAATVEDAINGESTDTSKPRASP